MDNELLIEAVRSHVALYDLSDVKYSDSTWKEKIWRQIGEEIKQPGAACKARWNNLRDQYRKALKKKKTKTGQAAKKIKKYKYEDQLGFLVPFLQERETVTNIVTEVSSNSEADDDAEDPGSDSNSRAEIVENTQTNVTDGSREKNALVRTTTPKRSSLKTLRAEKQEKPTETASSTLIKYLLEKNAKVDSPSSVQHPVDAFLSGISATLKTFTPYHVNLAKTKIFSVVQELEMAQIMGNGIHETTESNIPSASRLIRTTTNRKSSSNTYTDLLSPSTTNSSYTHCSWPPSPQPSIHSGQQQSNSSVAPAYVSPTNYYETFGKNVIN